MMSMQIVIRHSKCLIIWSHDVQYVNSSDLTWYDMIWYDAKLCDMKRYDKKASQYTILRNKNVIQCITLKKRKNEVDDELTQK